MASLPLQVIRFLKLCKNYALRLLTMDEKHPFRQSVFLNFAPFSIWLELNWSKYYDWNGTSKLKSRKKKVSQLFKLYSLIKEYLPSLKVEESDHRQLSSMKPYVANLVDIKVSSLSKEEEAIVHTTQLKNICSPLRDCLIIYCYKCRQTKHQDTPDIVDNSEEPCDHKILNI